jgi:hypothetical protein
VAKELTIGLELVTVGCLFVGLTTQGEGEDTRGTPPMPEEWIVLREDIARALLGEGLRIPMRPARQKFVEIDIEKDSLADIEAKLEALQRRLEAQGLRSVEEEKRA